MAKETVNILKDKIDIVELLAQLNAALSEEWLAFYQYWVGSFVVEGAMRGDVQREFQEHAAEEYNHAKLLADRIIELEGVPVLDPKQWFDLARCKYDAPVDFGSEVLLKQNVESERCAIYRYQQIAEFTNGIDFTTCDIAKAGVAVGVDGLFMETHEDPTVAKSDGANMLKLDLLEGLLTKLIRIRQAL